MSEVEKVIELVGVSVKSWEDAVETAVREASKTIRHLRSVEVTNMTVDLDENRIIAWRVAVKIAFGIESQPEQEDQKQMQFDHQIS